MNRSAKGILIETTVLVWRIAGNSPNSPNFLPAKLSRYTVSSYILCMITYLSQQVIPIVAQYFPAPFGVARPYVSCKITELVM